MLAGTAALLCALLCVPVAPAPAAAQAPTTVQTVPRIPGLRIEVQGQVVRTDQEGLAQFSEAVPLSSDTINVVDTRSRLSAGRRARFSKIRRTATGYVAAFDIDVLVTVDAATVGGDRIDVDRASRVQLRSPLTGDRRSVRVGEQVWLHSGRVVAELGTVRPREVPWSVQRFEIDGKQVVSRGQQRFVPADMPADARTVVVEARLYSVEITARDVLVGSPAGAAALLTHPDGATTRHALNTNGTVHISDLVPGAYEIAVEGGGPLIARPVTISRDQQIELEVYTWLDLAIVALVALIFFAGLAVVGRRRPEVRRARSQAVYGSSHSAAPRHDPLISDQLRGQR